MKQLHHSSAITNQRQFSGRLCHAMLCSFLSLCGCYPCNVVVGPNHADGRWHVHVHKESLTLCVMASNAVDGHLEAHVDVLASSVL